MATVGLICTVIISIILFLAVPRAFCACVLDYCWYGGGTGLMVAVVVICLIGLAMDIGQWTSMP